MHHLQFVYLCLYIAHLIGSSKRHLELRHNLTTVANAAHTVNGDAGLGLSRRFYRFVNVMPIHSSAAILGQQRGMNIEYPTVIFVYQIVGNHEQKAGKYDIVDAVFLKQRQHIIRLGEVGLANNGTLHTKVCGTCQRESIGTIADDNFHASRF